MPEPTLPVPDAPIEEIWQYARACSPKNGGFNEWWDWINWGSSQFKIYNEQQKLPSELKDLKCLLALCAERNMISHEFSAPETQQIPREIIKIIHSHKG